MYLILFGHWVRGGGARHEGQGRAKQTRSRGTTRRRGNPNSKNKKVECSGWESVRLGGSDNKADGLASRLVATGCQGNPCSNGIRWGVSPTAQMGCLRNPSMSPLGADQP